MGEIPVQHFYFFCYTLKGAIRPLLNFISYILYLMSLCDIQWEGVSTFHFFSGTDDYLLVGNRVIYDRTLFNHGILHQNTVPDNGSLFYLNASEQNAVLYLSFDDTAISYHNIGYLGSRDVSGWVIITNLGVDRIT